MYSKNRSAKAGRLYFVNDIKIVNNPNYKVKKNRFNLSCLTLLCPKICTVNLKLLKLKNRNVIIRLEQVPPIHFLRRCDNGSLI